MLRDKGREGERETRIQQTFLREKGRERERENQQEYDKKGNHRGKTA